MPTLALGALDQALDQDLATLLLALALVVLTLGAAARRPAPQEA